MQNMTETYHKIFKT